MSARRTSGILANLVNGISQQAPALRLDTQGEAQENFYSTIVEGLKDRPPTQFVAKLRNSIASNIFSHVINRDVTERYFVTSDGSTLSVTDFSGVTRTVNAPNGWGYLSCADPANDLRAITVADYTFIVNRTKTVAMSDVGRTPPANIPQALVNVMAGNYGKTYVIRVNGSVMAQVNTINGVNGAEPYIDTANIANSLIDGNWANETTPYNNGSANGANASPTLNLTLGSPTWSWVRYGNAIYICNNVGTDFQIECDDGFNGHAMVALKDRTDKFSNLPSFGPDGFKIKIVGDSNTQFDDYYVWLRKDTSGQAIWRETVAFDTQVNLDASTMPHILVREADGSFTFKEASWDPRVCGDANTSPDPSFVGRQINEVFFHKNRLGFLSGENVIMSRASSFFNFFRTSCTAVLDDDPIDVAASHVKVSILRNVAPFQGDLVAFSDQTQFKLQGNEMLTPKTVALHPETEYVNADVRPVGLGQWVFFTMQRGAWQSVWELMTDKVTVTSVANEVTSHCPAYIPSSVFKLTGSSNENVLVALTNGDPTAFYVYKYYWSAEQKLQSSWSRWSLPGVTSVLNAEFINSDLYLMVTRADGVYLERLQMQANSKDTGLDYMVHLDRRVHTDNLAAPSYNSTTKQTTYTLPYSVSPGILAVTASGGSMVAGRDVKVVSTSGSTVTVAGDTRTSKLFFGYTYVRSYTFSRIYSRQPNPKNPVSGTVVLQTGRLQLNRLTLSFNNTAYFRLEVTPKGRDTYSHVFSSRILGSSDSLLSTVQLKTGKRSFPIMTNADGVEIKIVNDTWMPSSFISVEWTGTQSSNQKR